MAAAMPSVQSLFGLFIIVLSVTNTDGKGLFLTIMRQL